MTIAHHPGLENLMSCSAGSMPEPFAAVMASHIGMCPVCRMELVLMHDIGVELFRSLPPSPLAGKVPIMALHRSEAEIGGNAVPSRGPDGLTAGGMPIVLAPYAGDDLCKVGWRRLAPGVQHFPIALSAGAKGSLRLLKIAPGRAVPAHGHRGSELTLVLRGSFRDETGLYGVGDVADHFDETEHQPVADPEGGCVCLVASEKKFRFKSVMARLFQPFTGL